MNKEMNVKGLPKNTQSFRTVTVGKLKVARDFCSAYYIHVRR